tara:strand:+ start:278 stop:12556 length:12279 start_codon:yes stop_codon:yes gene_type:complete
MISIGSIRLNFEYTNDLQADLIIISNRCDDYNYPITFNTGELSNTLEVAQNACHLHYPQFCSDPVTNPETACQVQDDYGNILYDTDCNFSGWTGYYCMSNVMGELEELPETPLGGGWVQIPVDWTWMNCNEACNQLGYDSCNETGCQENTVVQYSEGNTYSGGEFIWTDFNNNGIDESGTPPNLAQSGDWLSHYSCNVTWGDLRQSGLEKRNYCCCGGYTGETPILGCTDSTAVNFNVYANTDDGSCLYYGCTDPNAVGMNPDASITDSMNACSYYNLDSSNDIRIQSNYSIFNNNNELISRKVYSSQISISTIEWINDPIVNDAYLEVPEDSDIEIHLNKYISSDDGLSEEYLENNGMDALINQPSNYLNTGGLIMEYPNDGILYHIQEQFELVGTDWVQSDILNETEITEAPYDIGIIFDVNQNGNYAINNRIRYVPNDNFYGDEIIPFSAYIHDKSTDNYFYAQNQYNINLSVIPSLDLFTFDEQKFNELGYDKAYVDLNVGFATASFALLDGLVKDVDVVFNEESAQEAIDSGFAYDGQTIVQSSPESEIIPERGNLTIEGLQHYGYEMTLNAQDSYNVLYPGQTFNNVYFEGGIQDFQNLYLTWINNPDKIYLTSGYRDGNNDCCEPYGLDGSGTYNPDCDLEVKMRFKILNMWDINGVTDFFRPHENLITNGDFYRKQKPLEEMTDDRTDYELIEMSNPGSTLYVAQQTTSHESGSRLKIRITDEEKIKPSTTYIASLWTAYSEDYNSTTLPPNLDENSQNGNGIFHMRIYSGDGEVGNSNPNNTTISGTELGTLVEERLINDPISGKDILWQKRSLEVTTPEVLSTNPSSLFHWYIGYRVSNQNTEGYFYFTNIQIIEKDVEAAVVLEDNETIIQSTDQYGSNFLPTWYYSRQPIIYYYQPFMMDIQMETSPMYPCKKDQIIINQSLGYRDDNVYDLRFGDQFGRVQTEFKISRTYCPGGGCKEPGEQLIPGRSDTKNHQDFSILQGLKLTANSSEDKELFSKLMHDNKDSVFNGEFLDSWKIHYSNSGNDPRPYHHGQAMGSYFMVGCESGFILWGVNFIQQNGDDFYFSGIPSDAFGHLLGYKDGIVDYNKSYYQRLIGNGGQRTSGYIDFEGDSFSGTTVGYGPSNYWQNNDYFGDERKSFGFKRGEKIGIFRYNATQTIPYNPTAGSLGALSTVGTTGRRMRYRNSRYEYLMDNSYASNNNYFVMLQDYAPSNNYGTSGNVGRTAPGGKWYNSSNFYKYFDIHDGGGSSTYCARCTRYGVSNNGWDQENYGLDYGSYNNSKSPLNPNLWGAFHIQDTGSTHQMRHYAMFQNSDHVGPPYFGNAFWNWADSRKDQWVHQLLWGEPGIHPDLNYPYANPYPSGYGNTAHTEDDWNANDHFGIEAFGWFYAPETGHYKFKAHTDDGFIFTVFPFGYNQDPATIIKKEEGTTFSGGNPCLFHYWGQSNDTTHYSQLLELQQGLHFFRLSSYEHHGDHTSVITWTGRPVESMGLTQCLSGTDANCNDDINDYFNGQPDHPTTAGYLHWKQLEGPRGYSNWSVGEGWSSKLAYGISPSTSRTTYLSPPAIWAPFHHPNGTLEDFNSEGKRLQMYGLSCPWEPVDNNQSPVYIGAIKGEYNGGTSTLQCPDGMIIGSIIFDSYGRDQHDGNQTHGDVTSGFFLNEWDEEPNYTTGWCHSTCNDTGNMIGKNIVSFSSNNSTCGDPCRGTRKQRVLVAKCIPSPPESQTSDTFVSNDMAIWDAVDINVNVSEPGFLYSSLKYDFERIQVPDSMEVVTNPNYIDGDPSKPLQVNGLFYGYWEDILGATSPVTTGDLRDLLNWLNPSEADTPIDPNTGFQSEFRVNNDLLASGDVYYETHATASGMFEIYGLNELDSYVDNTELHKQFKFYADDVDTADERINTFYSLNLIKRGETDEITHTNQITLPSVNVLLLDANPPKIHNITFSGSLQRGIQNNQEVSYDNNGLNIISNEYINQVDSDGTYPNQDPNFGVYSIGSIDFSTYELGGYSNLPFTITLERGGEVEEVSDHYTFDETEPYAWEITRDAINAYNPDDPTKFKATAELVDNSNGDDTSNLKTIIVRSDKVGSQYNGILNWGPVSVNSHPLFNNLVNGEAYPVLHLYEGFSDFILDLTASDVDPRAEVSIDVHSSNPAVVQVDVVQEAEVNEIGDNFMIGGEDIPDLEVDSPLEGAGESITTAKLRVRQRIQSNNTTDINGFPAIYDNNGDLNDWLSPIAENFHGFVDISISAYDNNGLKDVKQIRLNIHPVNDPPLVKLVSDYEIYMNNQYYQTDINIELEPYDIENSNVVLREVKQITNPYCNTILDLATQMQTNALDYTGTPVLDENGENYFCGNLFNCITYCDQFTEYECSKADYNNDMIINMVDFEQCWSDANNPNNVPLQQLYFTNTPSWLKPYASQIVNPSNGQEILADYDYDRGNDMVDDYSWSPPGLTRFERELNVQLKNYIRVVPEYNQLGNSKIRISATDVGDPTGQDRSGFITASINISGINKTGPDGELLDLAEASFGYVTDTYNYTTKGYDSSEEIPTRIEKSFRIALYPYHDLTETDDSGDRIVDGCGNLQYYGDSGHLNTFGECCSSMTSSMVNPTEFFNLNKNYYYYQDFYDEISLYKKYYEPQTTNALYCKAEFLPSEVKFEYKDYITNRNLDGYKPPNQSVNPLDYTNNYILEVRDMIEDYSDEPDWWAIKKPDINYQEFWMVLSQQGWPTTGSNINYNKNLVKKTYTWNNKTLQDMIQDGFTYRYDYPSFYKVSISSSDSYGFTHIDEEIVDATEIVKFNQTLLHKFNPWQGWNLTGSTSVSNSLYHLEGRDIDKRPSLGLFYHDEFNKITDWNAKWGNSYQNYEQSPGDNWTGSYKLNGGKWYYNDEQLNKIQFSSIYDNYVSGDTLHPSNLKNEFHNTNNNYTQCESVDEDQSKTLTCPPGTVIVSVDFDSYGQPKGDCGNYKLSSGNTTQSIDWTGNPFENITFEEYNSGSAYWGSFFTNYVSDGITDTAHCQPDSYDWIGKNSVLIESNNLLGGGCSVITNGDPNPGYTKVRKVQVTCAESLETSGKITDYWAIGGVVVPDLEDSPVSEPIYVLQDSSIKDPSEKEFPYKVYQKKSHEGLEDHYFCNMDFDTVKVNNQLVSENPDWVTPREYDSSVLNKYKLYNDLQDCRPKCQLRKYNPCTQTSSIYSGSTEVYRYKCIGASATLMTSSLVYDTQYVEDWGWSEQTVWIYGNKTGSNAKNYCDANCYDWAETTWDTDEPFCTSVTSSLNGELVDKIPLYQYNLQQTIEIKEQKDVDRVFTVFLRYGGDSQSYRTTLEFEYYSGNTMVDQTTKEIFWNTDGTLDIDSINEINPFNEEQRNYGGNADTGVYMWYYDDIGNGWYRFYLRTIADSSNTSFTSKIYPAGKSDDFYNEGNVYIWGVQVEEIEPYNEILKPYQPTRRLGELGIYDFIPDVDIRSILSTDGYHSVLYKYYDEELQPHRYEETSAPIQAQLYFYIRDPFEEEIFKPKQLLDYPSKTLYIGFIDWGDGTEPEYFDEPKELTNSTILTHPYMKAGVYEVKGTMFNVVKQDEWRWTIDGETFSGSLFQNEIPTNAETSEVTENVVHGIANHKTFILRINVNLDSTVEGNWKTLGGEGFTFLPYGSTSPIVGGISEHSSYKKVLKRYLGYIGENDVKIGTHFDFYNDELNSEIALSEMDEKYIGRTMSTWTGSFATGSMSHLDDSDSVILKIEECIKQYNDNYLCTLNNIEYGDWETCYSNCQFVQPASASYRGFYSGSVDDEGKLLSNPTPKLIHRGIGTEFGELGDWTGDVDMGQVRYFNSPINMWEMLGFEGWDESQLGYNPPDLTEYVTWTFDSVNPNDANIPDGITSIFGQNESALFIEGVGWVGSLSTLQQGNVYYFKNTTEETIIFAGMTILPESSYYTLISLHPGNPSSPRYWKNIIPKDYTIKDREGVSNEMVDESSSQSWYENYYYPVLPKINRFGKFDDSLGYQEDKIPFGSPGRKWNEDDKYALITKINTSNTNYSSNIKIDLELTDINQEVVDDVSGNSNIGLLVSDYLIQFDENTGEPSKKDTQIKQQIGRKDKRKPY